MNMNEDNEASPGKIIGNSQNHTMPLTLKASHIEPKMSMTAVTNQTEVDNDLKLIDMKSLEDRADICDQDSRENGKCHQSDLAKQLQLKECDEGDSDQMIDTDEDEDNGLESGCDEDRDDEEDLMDLPDMSLSPDRNLKSTLTNKDNSELAKRSSTTMNPMKNTLSNSKEKQ